MFLLDWLVLISICVLSVAVGLMFTRQAGSKGEEGYFTANRSLSWFGIGISNASTYQSGLGAFVTLIFAQGLRGNWLWWTSWVIWMPLVALIWARMWRRMGIVTTAELISLRYEGRPAKIARKAYSLAMCCLSIILIGYMVGFFVKTIFPVLKLDIKWVLLIFGLPALLYTLMGGLLGSVKVALVQFTVMMVSSFVFWLFASQQHGGWANIIDQARQMRPESMELMPIDSNFFPLGSFIMFIILGFFFAGSPTAGEGMTAQRFLAAKNERHAIGGQLFNAFISLSLRIVPLIGLGIMSIALFDPGAGDSIGLGAVKQVKDPAYAWGELINVTNLPQGLVGLLIASEAAAFMSTLSALINWGSSFLVNDFYKDWFPNSNSKKQIMISRFIGMIIFILAAVLAIYCVDDMVSWFLYINSVVVIFWLPLAYFRFFWSRFNVWGELAATILGLPLSWIIWFILDFQNKPFWQGAGMLFLTAIASQVIITLLTPSEPEKRLELFFKRCRPMAGWKKWRNKIDINSNNEICMKNQIISSLSGIVACLGLVVGTNGVMVGNYWLFTISIIVVLIGGYSMLYFIRSAKKG